MEEKTPAAGHKIIIRVAKVLLRLLVIFFYVVAFFGFNCGFYAYMARKSAKNFVRYNADNMPSSFPILVTGVQDNGTPTVELEYLYNAEDFDQQTKLHQSLGKGEVQVNAYDNGHYHVEPISDLRKQITLSIWVSGGDRKERYVYEVEGNRVYPISFQLMAYFGWMFSAFPPALLATFIFIFVCEKLYRLITKRMAARKLKITP